VIAFSKPAIAVNQMHYLERASNSGRPWGGGFFYEAASELLKQVVGSETLLLTQSCTAALELAALSLEINEDDEVIVPSFTFVSSANAFALRGARIVFVDVDSESLNAQVETIARAITKRTRAIVVVHYGGVPAPVQAIVDLAKPLGIFVIEDAAQAVNSFSESRHLGTIGDIGCLSFHGTKNISSGEGGAIVFRSDRIDLFRRAEILHEKGTNRKAFFSGEVDKYTWQNLGSSFIPSEFTCAILLSQLEEVAEITQIRLSSWAGYFEAMKKSFGGDVEILASSFLGANGHMFAFLARSSLQRHNLLERLSSSGVQATSHYTPLHSSPFGSQFLSSSEGKFTNTDAAASRIVRLPLWSMQGLPILTVVEKLQRAWT
jgi:dTDP-4-amino-4,6-dideoxygalactose transaminase